MTLLLCFFLQSGCINENVNAPAEQNAQGQGKASGNTGKDDPNFEVLSVFKGKKMADFPSSTIGEAFDRYTFLTKKAWSFQRSPQNKNIYIDFVGWFDSKSINNGGKKQSTTGKGLEIKFVVYPDGSFSAAMASILEMKNDGKRYAYPIDGLNDILTKIYANKELKF